MPFASNVPSPEASRPEHMLIDALFDIVEATDHDQLYTVVVRWARRLVHSDIAYLGLNAHHDNSSAVSHPEGVHTEAFRKLRIPYGTGILGTVAKSSGSNQTVNYLQDASFAHDPAVDQVVKQEGIHSLLGVPIRNDRNAYGALLVGQRTSRVFNASEIERLSTLARFTSVILQKMSQRQGLILEHETANKRLHAAQEEIALLRAIDRLDQMLVSETLLDSPQQSFTELLCKALDMSVSLYNADIPLDEQQLPQAALAAIEAEALSTAQDMQAPLQWHDKTSDKTITLAAVTVNQLLIGGLITEVSDLSPLEKTLFQRSTVATAAFLASQRALREITYREESDLVDEILSPSGVSDSSAIIARMKEFGLTGPAFSTIVVVTPPHLRQTARGIIVRHVQGHGILTVLDSALYVVTNSDTPTESAEGIRLKLKQRGIAASVACDGPSRNVSEIRSAAEVARSLVKAMVELGDTSYVGNRLSMGSLGLLVGEGGFDASLRLVRRMIGVVIDHDRERNTELAKTALAYLDANQQVTHAAKTLHIHVNTARQRLERLDALLGDGWRRGRRAMDFHVAFRLWSVWFAGKPSAND